LLEEQVDIPGLAWRLSIKPGDSLRGWDGFELLLDVFPGELFEFWESVEHSESAEFAFLMGDLFQPLYSRPGKLDE
jgi:hypothetical protein